MAARRDLQLTRQRLLSAGQEMLIERGIDLGLRNLPVTDVAERAGYTTGAVYQIWPKQELFHRELSLTVVRHEAWADSSTIVQQLAPALEDARTLRDLIRIAGDAYLNQLSSARAFYVFAHFWAVALDDEDLRLALREGYDRLHGEFAELYATLLHHVGLAVAAPLTMDDLTVSVTALAEGFALRQRIDPVRVWPSDGDRMSLFATALEAVVLGFVEAIPLKIPRRRR